MPILNKLSGAFPATLIYITAGTLIDIWSVAWLLFYPPQSRTDYFWGIGFILTGIALLTIGLFLGRIGRAARTAELPPQEVTKTVTQIEQATASAEANPAPPLSPEAQATPPTTADPGLPPVNQS